MGRKAKIPKLPKSNLNNTNNTNNSNIFNNKSLRNKGKSRNSRKIKDACPVGSVCLNTNLILILLVVAILILMYFLLKPLHSQSNSNNNFENQNPNNLGTNNNVKKVNNVSNLSKNNMLRQHQENNRNNNVNQRQQSLEQQIQTQQPVEQQPRQENNPQKIVIQVEPKLPSSPDTYLINKDHERIINPLVPPERRNFHIDRSPLGVAINVPTRGYTGGAMQVGALYKQDTSDEEQKIGQNTEPVILPLFGGPTYNGSSKWYYYTSTDKYNQIKLPLSNKNRSCNVEYGCDELYDGDMVTVPAHNGEFKVVKYEYDKPRYLPHL